MDKKESVKLKNSLTLLYIVTKTLMSSFGLLVN